jgi:insulysin
VVLPPSPEGLGSLLRRADPGGPGNPNSAVLVQYQSGPEDRSLRRQMAMELLGAAIEQPFYGELRTRQQLGYIVFAGVRELEPGGARALNLVVQSGVADPPDLAARAVAFAEGFAGALAALPDARFRAYADALVQRRREGDKTLSAEAGRHWGEIAGGRLAFDRAAREAEALAALTKEEVLAAYRAVVLPGGAGRRVFTAEVYADRAAARPDAPPPAGAAPVPPPREFIAANALFPTIGAGPAVELAARPAKAG